MAENKKEYEKAVEYIVNLIKTENLGLGDKIPTERSLSDTLGISRTSTREALRILENTGLLESRQGSGNYIGGNTSDIISSALSTLLLLNQISYEEIYAFRRSMDKLVCALLMEQNESLDQIADEAEAIFRCKTESVEEEIEKDNNFHFYLINATKNRLLVTLLEAMSGTYRHIINNFYETNDELRKQQIYDTHINIVNSLRAKNMQLCEKAIDLHYMIASGLYTDNPFAIRDVNLEQERYDILIESQKMLNSLRKDSLTGLYTRDYFFQRVEEYIDVHSDQKLMFWTCDVIGLNVINEKYGFETGDDVLKAIAKNGIPGKSIIFGGRTEGDKFSALLLDEDDDFEKLNEIIGSYKPGNLPVPYVTIKNGVYHINREEKITAKAMFLRTILAINEIKDKYDTYVSEYDERFRKKLMKERQIIAEAGEAIERNEFKVYFQPKIRVDEGKVGGAEALVRWIHPELGFVSPGDFIPIFEQNGFITRLDFYVWEEVCKTISEWKKNGFPVVPISINVSRKDFQTEDLAEAIIALVDKYEVEHSLIEIEITESSYIDRIETVQEVVKKLHDAGFSIALDDFGTGYSSMSSLGKLELDVVKLDMSLIQNDDRKAKRNPLEFSFELAKMVKLKTVAEGIETEEQVKRISSLGCDYIQGYFYSKPIPKEAFEAYLKENI